MIKALIWSLLLLFGACFAHADQIYKHVDEAGNVTYSDEPQNSSSEKVNLKPLNTTPAIEIKTPPTPKPAEVVAEEKAPGYNLRIANPKPEQRFGPKEKMLSVVILTDQPLADNHYFQVYLDGKAYQGTTKSNNVNIPLNLPMRGQHTLYAAIVDGAGRDLEQCPAVTFFVIRPQPLPRATPN